MKAHELMRKTADHIDDHGLLIVGLWGEKDGPCCMVGTMRLVAGLDPFRPHDDDEGDEDDEAMADRGAARGVSGLLREMAVACEAE